MRKQDIYLLFSQMIMDILEENEAFKWEAAEEPFFNMYTNKISYDYSGEVKQMTKRDLQEIAATLGENEFSFCYESKLDELLATIHINNWTATYTSNYGKHWTSFRDLFEEKFNEWKYTNFELYDEDGNEINEGLEVQVEGLFFYFLRDTSHEIYLAKALRNIE